MKHKKAGDTLMVFSVIAAVISGYVSLSGSDILNLAGTQWMMIAITLAIYGVYANTKIHE